MRFSAVKRTAAAEGGAAAVEFALIASVLLMILFGILEYGRTFSEIEVMTSAAREGARVAAVGGTPSEIQARVVEAAAPYELDGPVTTNKTCGVGETRGTAVTVSFPHEIDVSIAFVPAYHKDVSIQGVFRCEL